jgi:hypothetical protein
MSDQTFIEWVPYKLTFRPATVPNGGSWAQLDAYARHLAGLRLPDPTKASAFRVAAEHVRDVVAASNRTPDVEDLDERVVSGDLSPQDALKMLGKRPDPEDARKQQRKRQDDADTLTRQLLHKAVLAIHSYGDDWLAMLRPIVTTALEKRDEGTWNRAHAFAAWLRDPLVKVCALAAAMANSTQDADPWLYQVGDAGRGVYLWRVEHSDAGQVVPGVALPLPNGGWRIAHAFKRNALLPTFADFIEHADEWSIGLYAAEQVIENMHRELAAQDAEIDALTPEPTPGKKRRVVMI